MHKLLIGAASAIALLGGAIAEAQNQTQPGGQMMQQRQPGGMMSRGGMTGDDDRGEMMPRRGEGYGMRDGSMGRPRHMGPNMMVLMMAAADTNGNQSLSLDEIQAVHARLFGYADADGNGELTLEEMRAFMVGRITPEQ